MELPAWFEEVRRRFLDGEGNVFLLTGAVGGLFPLQSADGKVQLLPAVDWLAAYLGGLRDVVGVQGVGGLRFAGAGEERFRALVAERRLERAAPLPTGGDALLATAEPVLLDPSCDVAWVVEAVERLAPRGSASVEMERLRRWVQSPELRRTNNLVVLLAADAGTVSEALRSTPGLLRVEVVAPKPAGGTQDVGLPAWAEELRSRYLAGEACMFVLHGGVRDLHRWEEGGRVQYLPLGPFLQRFFARTKEIVVSYNVSEGIEAEPAMLVRFKQTVDAGRVMGSRPVLGALPRSPTDVLPVLEELLSNHARSAAVLVDYLEMIVPRADLAFMAESDKANLVTLQRWASDPAIQGSDNVVVLVGENLGEVHPRVLASPQVGLVEVPRPSEAERRRFLESQDLAAIPLGDGMDLDALARTTAGLTLLQIRSLLRTAEVSGDPITFRHVVGRKKSIIEQECQGLVEFVEPEHDFSHVGGMDRVKADLRRIADAIKRGHRNRVPMGLIFVGPMGTGKTFVAEAFAGESGLACLKFKNFREKWVGSTEGNLERILSVVEALGYVLLIIDEADRSLGGSADNDGGTTSRVIARLKEFMSDTSHRGRILILLMTNRPDKLDTDLKRPGRFDAKVPFFFPEEARERLSVLQALVRRNRLDLDEGVTLEDTAARLEGYSAAELEAVVLAGAGFASANGRERLTAHDLAQACEDVIPSRDVRMLAFMEMLAVFEASSRRMLPDRFRDLDTGQVVQRLDLLRSELGRRVD